MKELAREAISDGSRAQLDILREELTKTGRALAALHQSQATYGETATLDEELVEIREVVGRLSLSVPQLTVAAEPLLARLEELSVEFPGERSVSAHHDFRPAQVLLHSGKVGFIDFDGASMAEPALDLGRFRAKLRDIGISVLSASGKPLTGSALTENLALLDGLCEHFLDAYREEANVSRERVLLWGRRCPEAPAGQGLSPRTAARAADPQASSSSPAAQRRRHGRHPRHCRERRCSGERRWERTGCPPR